MINFDAFYIEECYTCQKEFDTRTGFKRKLCGIRRYFCSQACLDKKVREMGEDSHKNKKET